MELGDLVTKMILELVDVAAVDAGGACDVARHSAICDSTLSMSRLADRQQPPGAGPDVVQRTGDGRHCRCWSASAAVRRR